MREAEHATGQQRPLTIPLLMVAGTLVAILVHGYSWELGAENQPLQIPVIERLGDPTLFPGDPAVDAFAKYRSVIFPMVAAFRGWARIETQFLVLHLATLAGVAAAMAALTRTISGSRAAALLAVLLLLASPVARPTPLGRDTMVATWVTPTTVSFPILLAAMALLIGGRSGWAGIVAGSAANLNLVMGGLFLIVAVPVALGEERPLRATARLVAGFGVAALPALIAVPGDALVRGRGLEFLELLRRYYPYHFFLGSHSRAEFVRLAILAAAAVAAVRLLPASEPGRRARRVLLAVAGAVAVGAFFTDLVPVAAVAQLHLLRADRWFIVILLAAGAAAIVRAANGRDWWSFAGALVLAAGLARGAYPLIAWASLVVLLIPGSNGRSRPWLLALLALAAAIVVTRAWDPGYRVTVVFAAILALGSLAAPRARALALALVIMIAFLELALANGTIGARGLTLARPVFPPDWREVQEWAARTTPAEARFITPPEIPGFRVYARRSTVVERKDGAAMLWRPSFGPDWWERFQTIEKTIETRDAAQLLAAARRYQAGWIVLPTEKTPQEMAPVHENPSYKVFAVREDSAGGGLNGRIR